MPTKTRSKASKRSSQFAGETVHSLKDRLQALALNLRWTWDPPTQRLFASIDPELNDALQRNPIALLHNVPEHRLERLASDAEFLGRLKQTEAGLATYLKHRPWYAKNHTAKQKRMRVAYFCAEFAIHESFPMYSGGLGVLAGDHLKSASDLGVPLCAVGLLYRHGYYKQEITSDGATTPTYPPYDFEKLAITDTGKTVKVTIGRRDVVAKVWLAQVGRVPVYLLDTDHAKNKNADDRAITHFLYGGDNETRIRQELLLGVGGVKALDAMGEPCTVLHLNEGHAAFAPLEVVRQHVDGDKLELDASIDLVKPHTVFTTHTPVPAGHDRFDTKLARKYFNPLLTKSKINTGQVLKLGSENLADKSAPLCMTALALRLSDHHNGVAELHGDVSRQMWQDFYGVANPKDVPIGHVTNGVHPQTWLAPETYPLYEKHLKIDWLDASPTADPWAKAKSIPDEVLWETRSMLRRRLVRFVRNHSQQRALRMGGGAAQLAELSDMLDENALTIGFARRFATYKRAPLIFSNLKRLMNIVGDDERPVQFIFAGKAHPADLGGQAYLQRVVLMSQKAGFKGRIAVLENYDMQIGRMLTSGSDIWLNNPLRPNEASGTSGMKPPLHGGVNLSILDGWWPEGFNKRNGYAIGDGREYKSQARQDKYDAGCIYELLEETIVPAFYTRGRNGVPKQWVKVMRESMRSIPAQFSTHRMLGDYVCGYYLPAHG
ncbi:MAG: alpha-glucan family phosphorylase [Planctomycetota bacterium]